MIYLLFLQDSSNYFLILRLEVSQQILNRYSDNFCNHFKSEPNVVKGPQVTLEPFI